MKKFVSIILCLIIMTVLFTGCQKNSWITGYDSKSKTSMIDSCIVAENDNFTLSFDKKSLNVSFLCKNNETVWNTVPENDKIETDEKSTLNIRVQDTQVRKESTHYSSAATRVSSKKDKNSVTITYYFDEVQISVPVTYTLRDDSLLLSINGKDVRQGSKRYQLIAAQPAPMMCRLAVDAENSYIFAPSGLGGTISNEVTPDIARKLTGTGANIASISTESNTNDSESTGFRCYGLKNDTTGIFCIAEETPGAVGINVTAGDKLKKYSSVYFC